MRRELPPIPSVKVKLELVVLDWHKVQPIAAEHIKAVEVCARASQGTRGQERTLRIRKSLSKQSRINSWIVWNSYAPQGRLRRSIPILHRRV
jgi:hypothetical protein